MSRKQEIYREILSRALPGARNCLSRFREVRPLRLMWPREQRVWRQAYQVAEFVHSIYFLILDEEFTRHDIHFLNFNARWFFERADKHSCFHPLFALYIQELFAEVPEAMRSQLDWPGPQGDYSRARPRQGDDPSWQDDAAR